MPPFCLLKYSYRRFASFISLLLLNVDYYFLLGKTPFPGSELQSPGLRNETLLENPREKLVVSGREEKEEA
mgnify:CR=1 FL=1